MQRSARRSRSLTFSIPRLDRHDFARTGFRHLCRLLHEDAATALLAAGALPYASTAMRGWSARLTGGLSARFATGGMVGLAAEYGGIGNNFQTWTMRAKAQVPL